MFDERDAGCGAICDALERYVEAELRATDSGSWFNSITVHLRHCTACRTDHDGLLAITEHERATCPTRSK